MCGTNFAAVSNKRWPFGSVGNVVGRVNEVNQRWARLVLGWGTVCRHANHLGYVASHPDQLSLAIRPWVGAMSTSESWDVNRHAARCSHNAHRAALISVSLALSQTTVYTARPLLQGPASVVWQCKLVSG